MARKDEFIFIRIMGFSDDANRLINKAIKYSGDDECENVNTVHLFLAILENTRYGKQLLDKMGTTFDMVHGSYLGLVENGEYGHFNSSDVAFSPEYFSVGLVTMISIISQGAMFKGKQVTVDILIRGLLKYIDETLADFLEYIGFNIEEMKINSKQSFSIPDEFADFIEDIHKSKQVTESTIENVDNYVDEMIEILSRKRKANPCLIGEAGVGKTTIVYRLAQRINSKNVPDSLKNTRIVYINGATLTSGTKYRGEFEERMKGILQWAAESDVILFLDEIHTFINSGDTGHNDGATAGNMVKRYLSDGTIRIIGATTLKEYHTSIERDKAFNRRVQTVIIKEPNVDAAINMIKLTISDYEKFHSVKIPEEVIIQSVKLSDRYVKDNFLPDKAYTIIDQACAKAKLAGNEAVGIDDVLSVVSKTTGINVNKLGSNENKQLIKLEETIGNRLIGQENAVKTVCKAIRRAKSGVRQANKPIASFLFVGPTGVGKTELCKVLSQEVAMGETPLIKIDMSEFGEKNSISRLLGTTAGYIGYGEGGQLTEKVKHNPYSIVLLDEIEKAHPDIFNTFLQLLDEGRLTDGEGTTVDFTNCIIVMTSNAGYGADGMQRGSLGFNNTVSKVDSRENERRALKALEETFKPEFLNRIDNVVIFEKLTKEQCNEIVKLMLKDIETRLKDKNIKVRFTKSIIEHIVEIGYSDKYGARNLRREIQDTVEDALSDAILGGDVVEGESITVKYIDKVVICNNSRK